MGRLLFAVSQAWRRLLAQRLCEEGLSDTTALCVMEISRARDSLLSQRELAQRLGLEGSAVVRLLDNLEGADLLQRLDDPADRRIKRLELTGDGHALSLRIERIVGDLREALLGEVDPADVAAMERVLAHLSASLDDFQARPRRV